LVELKFAESGVEFAESDIEFAESGVEFAESGVSRSKFKVGDDSGGKSCFDVNLTVLIEANAEIAVEVERGLYSSVQCVSIRCILQNISPL